MSDTVSGENLGLGYLWGDDAFGLDQAVATRVAALSASVGPVEVVRIQADLDDASEAASGATSSASRRRSRLLDEIEQRIGTATLFGGGTVVVVRQPGLLLRDAAGRKRLLALISIVPSGNGLMFTDLTASGARGPAAAGVLRNAIADAGGFVEQHTAPSRDRMEGWISRRASELGLRLGAGSARLLAERIGASVREGDIDRRRHTQLANQELEKLALFSPDQPVTRDDIAALVPEEIPGSTWAFLDAVGIRNSAGAAQIAERLLTDELPLPVLVSQLHRRLRDLIVVRDLMDDRVPPAEIVKALKIQPFRAQKLAEQAQRWTTVELAATLNELLEIDLVSKGIAEDGSTTTASDQRMALRLQTWIAGRVMRTN